MRETAKNLFLEIQKAWDAEDRVHLRGLVASDLLAEWERRLDDFDRRGWRNHVEPIGDPQVEYVGEASPTRATARTIAWWSRSTPGSRTTWSTSYGRHLQAAPCRPALVTRIREFWTLGRRGPHWVLVSIEQGAEGKHALDEQIVATPWADERAMHDEAMVEAAVADAVPEGTKVSEVAELQFEGDAQDAANDLSVADGRFAPDVLEIAARRAVQAWAEAVDGRDTNLRSIATPAAAKELLYAGDATGRSRLVVRGPAVNRIRIVGLDAQAEPPTMTVEVDITGRRYLEDRDTTAVLAGSRSRATRFTEHWTMALNGDQAQPWRITAVSAPVGLA